MLNKRDSCGRSASSFKPAVELLEDRLAPATIHAISTSASGVFGNSESLHASISADGRYVAFTSGASNLVSGDRNGQPDIFRKDLQTGEMVLVSIAANGTQANGPSSNASISADGRYVAFTSEAANLAVDANGQPVDTNGQADIFRKDLQTGVVVLVSIAANGTQANGPSSYASISADGQYVAFTCGDPNFVPEDVNGHPDVFRKDLHTGVVVLVSTNPEGLVRVIFDTPSISADGRYVAFRRFEYQAYEGPTKPDESHIIRKDLVTGAEVLVTIDEDDDSTTDLSDSPSISADGKSIAFDSTSSKLVPGAGGGHVYIWSPQPSRNPLIFIPGIAGSTLVDSANSDELWVGWPAFDSRRDLTLDEASEHYRPGIVATDAVRSVTALGRTVAQIYGPMLEALTDQAQGGYTEFRLGHIPSEGDKALYVFPYDWRKDNALSARKLAEFIDSVALAHPNQKVDILAHSMGGLVARRYILDRLTNHNVAKLITIGAPWLGAPKLPYVLETGDWIPITAAGGDLRYIMPTLTGAHQLAPSSAYYDLARENPDILLPFREDGWDYNGSGSSHDDYLYADLVYALNKRFPVPATTPDRMPPGTANLVFHTRDQDDWRSDRTGIAYYHFVGIQPRNDTVGQVLARESISLIPGEDGRTIQRLYVNRLMLTEGDGTVPVISASRIGAGSNLNAPSSQVIPIRSGNPDLVEHTALTAHEQVLSDIFNLLAGRPLRPPGPSEGARAGYSSAAEAAPSYYLTVLGGSNLIVRDSLGNSNDVIAGDIRGRVPGVSTYWLGDQAEMAVLGVPYAGTYQFTFQVGSDPLALELVKGVDSQTPILLIRYLDKMLPAGVTALLSITPTGVEDLRYDADGDGTFESSVPPTVHVDGTKPVELEPPHITFRQVVQRDCTHGALSALDKGSGVKQLLVSTDGVHFEPYTKPLQLDPAKIPVVYALAEDHLGNRTSLFRFEVSSVSLTEGVLNIVGTSGKDRVTVKRVGMNAIQIGASFLASPRTFSRAEVTRINMALFAGKDSVSVGKNVIIDMLIDGGAGSDILRSGGGNDILLGGPGADTLRGGRGNDILLGGQGDDMLYGSAGLDAIFGEAGMDVLFGKDGDDILAGGQDADRLIDIAGRDAFHGGADADRLRVGREGRVVVDSSDKINSIGDDVPTLSELEFLALLEGFFARLDAMQIGRPVQ